MEEREGNVTVLEREREKGKGSLVLWERDEGAKGGGRRMEQRLGKGKGRQRKIRTHYI